jgi:RNA recognition motif-containing protein
MFSSLFRIFISDGVPQSRGFAFVEFTHHAHALACLRELNNNPVYAVYATTNSGRGQARLIVEFTLENIQKVSMTHKTKHQTKYVYVYLNACASMHTHNSYVLIFLYNAVLLQSMIALRSKY